MTPDKHAAHAFEPVYRSGIAARLAGVPVETLRVWERRYGVIAPRVDPRGHRLYSAEDVGRLALIRQLVELGSSIGSIANLPLAALREMRSAAAVAAASGRFIERGGSPENIHVALVGEALAQQLATPDGQLPWNIEIVAACSDSAAATRELEGVTADVLVIALPTLHADCVKTVDALVKLVGAARAVIEYRFGPVTLVHALRERRHTVARAPLDAEELERICREEVPRGNMNMAPESESLPPDIVPRRRFDDRSLARIARALTTLYCECPRHVVELLRSLDAFEHYSAQCANRDPSDAELHRYLQRVAGSARAMFEDALVRIARAEKVALPVVPGDAGATA